MRLACNIGLLTAGFAALTATASVVVAPGRVLTRLPVPDLVEVRPGTVRYRASGDFSRDARPAPAPIVQIAITRTLAVMKHQVTAADYGRCVYGGACPAVDGDASGPDRPLINVSWRDAHAYAEWLSGVTGARFRLPTDEEWAHATGGRFHDDELPETAYGGDPGQRALAIYAAGARGAGISREVQPIGSFGVNENGLVDVGGNVSEWTDTCFVRVALDVRGETASRLVNCGIRVVEGRHRSYLPDFIRDARAGGCSIGPPPTNLGLRLVRDDHRRPFM